MTDQQGASEADVSGWQAESLRFTVFPRADTQVTVSDWWQELVGEPPESHVTRPREGIVEETGPFANGSLTLSSQPTRIDWLYGTGEPVSGGKWVLGSAQEQLDIFTSLIMRWLDHCPQSQRLALGAVLLRPVADRQSGYIEISHYLHSVEIDPEGSQDLLYQINRPRQSQTALEGLRINRLARWSVARLGTSAFSISPQDLRIQFFDTSETYACRVQLDINTAANFQGDIPRDKHGDLLQEFVALIQEILSQGDVQ